MIRVLRVVLYGVAIISSLIGLVAGGKSLARYAVARIKDPYFDSFSYNDLVFSGSVIFLLSLLVLIFADISLTLGRAFRIPKPKKETPTKLVGLSARAGETNLSVQREPVSGSEADHASADEKIARLLKQKNE